MMNLNVEVNEETKLSNIDKELYSFGKYLKYRRKGLITNGNYNWLIIDPTLMNHKKLVEQIEKYIKFDNMLVNVIRDIDYYNSKNEFSEINLIAGIKEEVSPSFRSLKSYKAVNIIVISRLIPDVAKTKFGKYCTFIADFSEEKFVKINSTDLINNIAENNFVIKNKKIVDNLVNLDSFETDKILAKAEISALNNKTTELDNYIDFKNSKKLNNYLKELNQLIGQDKAKKTLLEIINYLKISKKRDDIPCLNMCFLGEPGTRKNNCCKNCRTYFI